MKQDRKRRYQNGIAVFAVMGASALLMALFFDFYFDMNDDTMMRDIMSGIYGGTPDGHNMQTLYPLGAAIALCYRLYRPFPWYGLFLFLCQFGCFFLVGVRLCALTDTSAVWRQAWKRGVSENNGAGDSAAVWRHIVGKLLCLSGLALFQWGIWLTHMVNIQYTITCGMLVGTAVFLFLTAIPCAEKTVVGAARRKESPAALSVRTFLMKSLPSLLLFLLAFWLRSEMALLTLPFLGLSGLFCWWEEKPVLTGKTLKKYGGLLLLLLAGIGISLAVDSLAYGGEWREFCRFFNDRTTIYDFYPDVLPEEPSDADLHELGVTSGAQILLKNYNFALDEGIDAQMLSDVAAYAREHAGGARDWSAALKDKLSLYRYRSFHGGDAPYNLLVWFAYAANIISAVILSVLSCGNIHHANGAGALRGTSLLRAMGRKLLPMGLQLLLLLIVRSALWMFILMRGRDPERITHPLYLAEFCLLAGMLIRRIGCGIAADVVSERADLSEAADVVSKEASAPAPICAFLFGAASALALLCVWGLWKAVPTVQADQARRQVRNRDMEAIDVYCRAHPDTFYFEDVYSTVAFSGRLLECRENTLANYDIAGGWMCKSPLYREKLAAFGIGDAADALADGRADFIMSDEEVSLRGLAWLEVPFAEKGLRVYVGEYDRIGENYGVYQVVPLSEEGALLREAKRER